MLVDVELNLDETAGACKLFTIKAFKEETF